MKVERYLFDRKRLLPFFKTTSGTPAVKDDGGGEVVITEGMAISVFLASLPRLRISSRLWSVGLKSTVMSPHCHLSCATFLLRRYKAYSNFDHSLVLEPLTCSGKSPKLATLLLGKINFSSIFPLKKYGYMASLLNES